MNERTSRRTKERTKKRPTERTKERRNKHTGEQANDWPTRCAFRLSVNLRDILHRQKNCVRHLLWRQAGTKVNLPNQHACLERRNDSSKILVNPAKRRWYKGREKYNTLKLTKKKMKLRVYAIGMQRLVRQIGEYGGREREIFFYKNEQLFPTVLSKL